MCVEKAENECLICVLRTPMCRLTWDFFFQKERFRDLGGGNLFDGWFERRLCIGQSIEKNNSASVTQKISKNRNCAIILKAVRSGILFKIFSKIHISSICQFVTQGLREIVVIYVHFMCAQTRCCRIISFLTIAI